MILVFYLAYDFAANMKPLTPSIPGSIIDYTNTTETIPTYDDINISSSLHKSFSYDPQIPPTLPISLDDLGTHVASCHSDGNAAFSEQYKVIIIYDSISFCYQIHLPIVIVFISGCTQEKTNHVL